MTRSYQFTSESVSEGHPDKLADQISDAILDSFLTEDRNARVACETLVADNLVVIAGEFRTSDEDVFQRMQSGAEATAREVLGSAGYGDRETGIDPGTCEVIVRFNRQSLHIAQGVDRATGPIGAGDQGLMVGYACDETPQLMPLPIMLAHALVARQALLRRTGEISWLRPDAKSQVTVRYESGRPVSVETVVLSTQHADGVASDEIESEVIAQIIEPVIGAELRSAGVKYHVNPTGRFVTGGPNGDTGVTGRKIIVDTYGGACPHGGGAFSGKDATKVDRSGAYMARYVAKNVVAAGLARRCTLQIAYAIGKSRPVSVYVDLHGTGSVDESRVEHAIAEVFDLTPAGIIATLDLLRPIYRRTSVYGHFGRAESEFTWERTDKVDALRSLLCQAGGIP